MYAYQMVQHAKNVNRIREVILGEDNPFDVASLHEDILTLDSSVSAFNFIQSYDLSKLISPNVINITFPCHFYKGNLAWMSEHAGHYRYFSRNFKGHIQSFDLFDFLYVYYDTENPSSIINLLSNHSGVIFLDKRWRKNQEEKYLKNIEWSKLLTNISPNVQRILSPQMDVYRFMNNEGMRHLGPMNLSSGRDAMFFVSSRFVAEKLNISPSKVIRICLYLEAIGLIKRIGDEDIPEYYLAKSKEMSKNRKRVNYYILLDVDKKIDELSSNCLMLKSEGITPSSITNSVLRPQLLG